MNDLRTAAQQALEALEDLADCGAEAWSEQRPCVQIGREAITALKAALPEPVLQTCNCRWDGEVQVQQCTLHEAHVDAIHEWAERAKTAEKKLAALAEHYCDTHCTWADHAPECPLAEPKQDGCDHCNQPLYAAVKCRVCGRVTEPVQEPVAWRWGYRSVTTGEMDWRGYVDMAAHPNLRSPEIIMEPLYTAPTQRKPLTEGEISNIWDGHVVPVFGKNGINPIVFARAIEAKHGIGGQQ